MERRIAKRFVPIACVAGIGLVVTGCASAGAQHETAAMPATPATSVIALPVAAATATPTPVAPAPLTAVPVTMKTDAVAPRFDTPEAAMRYLVAAYNANNETNIRQDRKSTRLNSSHPSISYAVFCLKKKTNHQ